MKETLDNLRSLAKEIFKEGIVGILLFVAGIILSPIGLILYLQFRKESLLVNKKYKNLISSLELESFVYENNCFKASYISMVNNQYLSFLLRTSSGKRKKREKVTRKQHPHGIFNKEEFESKLLEYGIKEIVLNKDIEKFNDDFISTFKYSENTNFELIFNKEKQTFDIKTNTLELILFLPLIRFTAKIYSFYEKTDKLVYMY